LHGVGQLATKGEISSQQPNTELNKTSNWSPPASHISITPSYSSSLHSPGAEKIRKEYTEDGHPLYIHARILEILSRLQTIHTCVLSHILHFGAQIIVILCSSNPPNNAYSSCADSCIRDVSGVIWSIKHGLISRPHACYKAMEPINPLMEAQFHHIPALTWPMPRLQKNKHESTQLTG